MSMVSVPKAIGAGAICAAVALACWMAFQGWPEVFVLPYVAALVATAACGLYVLIATWADSYRNPRRGIKIRPIRGFDIAAGLLLTAPSLWALSPFVSLF